MGTSQIQQMKTALHNSPAHARDRDNPFPSLFAMFGATEDVSRSSTPMLLQQGMDAMEGALAKGPGISREELESILADRMERLVQFEECTAAGLVAIALYCQSLGVPPDVRFAVESILELIVTKLEERC